jgi:hypothetical protein
MAFFDQMTDPTTMALLGALQGVSQFAGASRLPQTLGQALGGGAAGLMAGIGQGQKYQQGQQELTQGNAKIGQLLDQMRYFASATGGQAPSLADLRSGNWQGMLSNLPSPGPGAATGVPGATPSITSPSTWPTILQSMLPSASAAAGLPPDSSSAPNPNLDLSALTNSIHQLESGGRVDGVPDGKSGEIGPMQIMPATAAGYGVGAAALRVPQVNLQVGGQIVGDLAAKYNDPEATAIAYNGGPGTADKWLAANRDDSVLPRTTQNYVSNFRQIFPQYAQAGPATATDAGSAAAPQPATGAPQPATGATQPATGFAGINPQSLIGPMMLRNYLGIGGQMTPAMNSMMMAGMMGGNPAAQSVLMGEALKAAGMPMMLGGERPGVPGRVFSGFDAQGRPQYQIGFQNPKTDTGQLMGPGGQIATAPGYVPSMAEITAARGWAGVPPEMYKQGVQTLPGSGVAAVPNFSQTMGGIKGAEAGAVTSATNAANFGGLLPGGALPGAAGPAAPGSAAPQAAATGAPSTPPPISLPGVAPGTPVPLSVAANNMTARIYHPVDTGRGTVIPPLNQQVIPGSAKELEAAIPAWQTKQTEWNASIAPAQAAQQRLNSIANAFKMIQSGAWQTDKAAFDSTMKSLGLPTTFTDPGQVEIALHSNYAQTLLNLKAETSRFTQSEFRVLSEKSEHPNLQPEANLEMLSQDMATLARGQQLAQDWNTAQPLGWKNSLSFETAWTQANPLSNMVQWQRQNIGPLKGMAGTATHVNPQTGQTIYQQGNQWFDATTNQPLAPASTSVPIR